MPGCAIRVAAQILDLSIVGLSGALSKPVPVLWPWVGRSFMAVPGAREGTVDLVYLGIRDGTVGLSEG